MKYLGKKTDILQLPAQLRCDPDLGSDVRFIASMNGRTIGMQILYWIVKSVEKEKDILRQVASGEVRSGAQPKSVNVRERQEKRA